MDTVSIIQAAERASELKGDWYVLYVGNNKEMKIKNTLDCRAVVPIAQEITIREKNGKKSRIVKNVPKYKNYIYVEHDGSKDFFQRILTIEGVVSFPGGKGLPTPISKEEIQHILTHELPKNILVAGDEVYVVDGQYKNLSGVIKSVQDDICTLEIKILDVPIQERIPKLFLVKKET